LEQAVFLAFAITLYFVINVAVGAAIVYVAMGAIAWMLGKEAITSYF
jgi:hypothetical protein